MKLREYSAALHPNPARIDSGKERHAPVFVDAQIRVRILGVAATLAEKVIRFAGDEHHDAAAEEFAEVASIDGLHDLRAAS